MNTAVGRWRNGRDYGGGCRGVSLIELMVAVVVLAILLGIAVPSFRNAALSSRLTGYANDLVASAQIARSEAIKRNATVVLCSAAEPADPGDPLVCSGGDGWEVGWVVGMLRDDPDLDEDGNPIVDADGNPVLVTVVGEVIHRQTATTPEFRIAAAGGVSTVLFPPTVAGVTPATFTVCRASPVGREERVVTISASGAASVARTEAGACP